MKLFKWIIITITITTLKAKSIFWPLSPRQEGKEEGTWWGPPTARKQSVLHP
jgi:hypothetical protein